MADCCRSGFPATTGFFPIATQVFEKLGLPGDRSCWHGCRPIGKACADCRGRTESKSGNVFEMPDVDPDELNSFLKSRNAVLLVKPHPMAAFDTSQALEPSLDRG